MKKANKKTVSLLKTNSFPYLAQRKGFEPLYTFLHNTISNRARSTAPPSLQTAFILYINSNKKATVFALFLKFSRRIFTCGENDFFFTVT